MAMSLDRIFIIRAFCLYWPILAAGVLLFYRRPTGREVMALILATIWNLSTLIPLNLIAIFFGFWHFDTQGGLAQGGFFWGLPFDLILGWSVLWGVIPRLLFPRFNLVILTGFFFILDFILMPLAEPLLRLSPHWYWGEFLCLVFSFIPAQLFTRWTVGSSCLRGRVFLQMICFILIFYLVMPLVYFQFFPGWEKIREISIMMGFFLVQLIFLTAIPGLSAVLSFMKVGWGTPFPYDPPQRLVTSGVYAYMINPMQTSTALIYLVMGFLWHDFIFVGAMSVIYSAGLAHWHENAQLEERFVAWRGYIKTMHFWRPRWRPSPLIPEAKLYYDDACGACQDVMKFFSKRSPTRLKLIPARLHPTRVLMRLTYEASDGVKTEGVSAFGAALNHLHLAWAYWGWILQFPFIRPAAQVVADALGPEPHAARKGSSLYILQLQGKRN